MCTCAGSIVIEGCTLAPHDVLRTPSLGEGSWRANTCAPQGSASAEGSVGAALYAPAAPTALGLGSPCCESSVSNIHPSLPPDSRLSSPRGGPIRPLPRVPPRTRYVGGMSWSGPGGRCHPGTPGPLALSGSAGHNLSLTPWQSGASCGLRAHCGPSSCFSSPWTQSAQMSSRGRGWRHPCSVILGTLGISDAGVFGGL